MKKIPVGDSGAKIQLNGRISCKTEIFLDINPGDCGSCPCPWHGLGMGYLRSLPIWNSQIFTSGLGGVSPPPRYRPGRGSGSIPKGLELGFLWNAEFHGFCHPELHLCRWTRAGKELVVHPDY